MINRNRLRVIVPGILVFAAIGSGSFGDGRSRDDTVTPVDLPPAVAAAVGAAATTPVVIVNANNNFGFRLLKQMRSTDAGKNVCISPVSVALCLESLYNGAAGKTQQAMAKTLGLSNLSTAELNQDNADLQASLVSTDPTVQLTIANSLWYRKADHVILDSFVNTNKKYYGSEIGDLAGAPDNINMWVSKKTSGNIAQILDPNTTAENYVSVLVNAVYFKGEWTLPFVSRRTEKSTFTLADGVTMVPCTLMSRMGRYDYYKGDHFQAIQLPYGRPIPGKPSMSKLRTTMLVFLPDPGVTVDNVLAEINSANLSTWLPRFSNVDGWITLPKFTSKYRSDLRPVLTALDMGVVFDEHAANFSRMGKGIFVSTAIHETYLSVDEHGTTVAGGSVAGESLGGSSNPFKMFVNRPFICAILDQQTGEILFYGAIDTPDLEGKK